MHEQNELDGAFQKKNACFQGSHFVFVWVRKGWWNLGGDGGMCWWVCGMC